jgi:hypothetical protein
MTRRGKTINRHLVDQLGVRRALLVEAFVMLWSLYRATHDGDDPRSIEELAAEIGKSNAQVYRWQQDFRQAFPDWRTPGDLLDHYGLATALTVRQVGLLGVA